MTWPKNPNRHSLSSRGIPNRAFGIANKDLIKMVGYNKTVDEEKEARALFQLMVDPSTAERQFDRVYVDTDDGYIRQFSRAVEEIGRDRDIQPDFLFDARDFIWDNYRYERLNELLYIIHQGHSPAALHSDSFRASLAAFMLSMLQDDEVGHIDWSVAIQLMSPEEKKIVFPKYIERFGPWYTKEMVAFISDVPESQTDFYMRQLDRLLVNDTRYDKKRRDEILAIKKLTKKLVMNYTTAYYKQKLESYIRPKKVLKNKKEAELYFELTESMHPRVLNRFEEHQDTHVYYMRNHMKKSLRAVQKLIDRFIDFQIKGSNLYCAVDSGNSGRGPLADYLQHGFAIEEKSKTDKRPVPWHIAHNIGKTSVHIEKDENSLYSTKSSTKVEIEPYCYNGELTNFTLPNIDKFSDIFFGRKWSGIRDPVDKSEVEAAYEYYILSWVKKARKMEISASSSLVETQPEGYVLKYQGDDGYLWLPGEEGE